MITLDPTAGYLTLINTFTVEPDDAERLLDELTRATRDQFQNQPGFISANLHLDVDRTHVTNYAQWRSRADYDAATQNDDVKQHMARAARLATSFDPIFYELRESIGAS
ncbi:antibiotic biosynthesis monooxygenase family protein [Agreia sp.]|uniref:antibiotic biosynthesis monooxygenase family protein n=1 Tax=Agreia sp. TaxID=1872416 RepID=UPI0035BC7278